MSDKAIFMIESGKALELFAIERQRAQMELIA